MENNVTTSEEKISLSLAQGIGFLIFGVTLSIGILTGTYFGHHIRYQDKLSYQIKVGKCNADAIRVGEDSETLLNDCGAPNDTITVSFIDNNEFHKMWIYYNDNKTRYTGFTFKDDTIDSVIFTSITGAPDYSIHLDGALTITPLPHSPFLMPDDNLFPDNKGVKDKTNCGWSTFYCAQLRAM